MDKIFTVPGLIVFLCLVVVTVSIFERVNNRMKKKSTGCLISGILIIVIIGGLIAFAIHL